MPSPANLSGVPALALPCGFSAAGLPLGLQIMGRHWDKGDSRTALRSHIASRPLDGIRAGLEFPSSDAPQFESAVPHL